MRSFSPIQHTQPPHHHQRHHIRKYHKVHAWLCDSLGDNNIYAHTISPEIMFTLQALPANKVPTRNYYYMWCVEDCLNSIFEIYAPNKWERIVDVWCDHRSCLKSLSICICWVRYNSYTVGASAFLIAADGLVSCVCDMHVLVRSVCVSMCFWAMYD